MVDYLRFELAGIFRMNWGEFETFVTDQHHFATVIEKRVFYRGALNYCRRCTRCGAATAYLYANILKIIRPIYHKRFVRNLEKYY